LRDKQNGCLYTDLWTNVRSNEARYGIRAFAQADIGCVSIAMSCRDDLRTRSEASGFRDQIAVARLTAREVRHVL
jgi:hypothetical protein